MGVEIVTDHCDSFTISITSLKQVCYLKRPIRFSALRTGMNFTPASQWLCKHKNTICACTLIFIINTARSFLGCGDRVTGFSNQLNRLLIHTNDWTISVVRALISF
uniref:Uncharacterized protein n=3 Tax=Candidatus Kentrum eta TaxID=2126337 RepID=A0A450W4G8_9GAMM|nr:MAG: hypothetical protein BECKH772C_GA0070978_108921 [Candidatus Kentron sp. H]